MTTGDPEPVAADDKLLDNLGAGQVPVGDRLATGLAARRAEPKQDEEED